MNTEYRRNSARRLAAGHRHRSSLPVARLGRSLATTLGHAAHWIAAALLTATGLYAVVQALVSPVTS